MILTEKAEEKFYEWINDVYPKKIMERAYGSCGYIGIEDIDMARILDFEIVGDIVFLQLALEWFDSVGIDIEINLFREKNELGSKVYFKAFVENEIVEFDFGYRYYFSRQEATTEAIKKANEIYNQKYL